MSSTDKNTKCKDFYAFFPNRPIPILFLSLSAPIFIALCITIFLTRSINGAALPLIISGFFLFLAIYSFPSMFHKIVIDSSGIKSINTHTGEYVFQPWNNIAVCYTTYTSRGSGICFFAVTEYSLDEVLNISSHGGVKKGKPVLSVAGNIFFSASVDPKKYEQYLPITLKRIALRVR